MCNGPRSRPKAMGIAKAMDMAMGALSEPLPWPMRTVSCAGTTRVTDIHSRSPANSANRVSQVVWHSLTPRRDPRQKSTRHDSGLPLKHAVCECLSLSVHGSVAAHQNSPSLRRRPQVRKPPSPSIAHQVVLKHRIACAHEPLPPAAPRR